MSGGTPVFVITDLGLAVASTAAPTGPFISLTSFAIGSAFGYTPEPTDTGLNGTLLYTGVPTSYENIGNNTLNIICNLPPGTGPFQFGEVALYLAGGTMFAKAVFDTPQQQYSSLGSNVISSYTFNCLIKLQQSTAVFQIDTICAPPTLWNAYQWSDIYPPELSANPDIPLVMCAELSERGDSTLLSNTSASLWTIDSTYDYYNIGTTINLFPVENSTTSWVQVPASDCNPADLTAPNRRFVIRTYEGYFRSVSSVVTAGSNYQFNLNVTNDGTYNNIPLPVAPAIGSNIAIFRDDGAVFADQIAGGGTLATVGNPGLAYGGSGLVMPTAGEITAYGLLHGPADGSTWPGMGRKLTSADDLNDTTLPSGCYDTAIGASGVPANWPPVSWDGILQIVNYGTITQFYNPEGYGGSNTGGITGVPMYYRSYSNQASAWSDWFSVAVVGKSSPTSYNFAPQLASTNYIPSPSSVETLNLSFTAPCTGYVLAFGTENKSQFESNTIGQGSTLMVVSITTSDSLSASGQDHTQLSKTDYANLLVNMGTTITIDLTVTADAAGNFPQASLILGYTFYPAW